MAVRVSNADFEEKVLKEKLTVLVDFYSDSCVACKKLAPVLGNAEDDYEDKIKIYKVNTNFDVELAEQYEVQANPTLILLLRFLPFSHLLLCFFFPANFLFYCPFIKELLPELHSIQASYFLQNRGKFPNMFSAYIPHDILP